MHIANFTDGRGYALARLLRERYGYRGKLRAIGEVPRDQLHYLARRGFDAFALGAEQDPERALAALGEFSVAYQAAAEPPKPRIAGRTRARARA